MAPRKRAVPPPVEAPAPCDEADEYALRALQTGTATSDQQRRALKWIVEQAAGSYDQPFRPGADGDRDTAFACGRMFVGQQIVHLLNTVRVSPKK